MDVEKSKQRPPFRIYINVKHSGLIARKSTYHSTIDKEERKMKKTDNATDNGASSKSKIVPSTSKQVPEAEKKALKAVQSSDKTVKSTVSTKKEMKTDPVKIQGNHFKTATLRPKKENKKETTLKDNKENLAADNNKMAAVKKKSPHFTRSSTKAAKNSVAAVKVSSAELPSTSSSASSSSQPEPVDDATLQTLRLQEETTKLIDLRDTWLNKEKYNELPERIRDEILSVTGMTTLLVTSKFEQFKSLIDDFALQSNNSDVPQRIVADDLYGFWELIYIQVQQLHNKYEKLEKLMQNNWQEEKSKPSSKNKHNNINAKRTRTKKPMKKTIESGKSRFKDFLNKKKEENKQIENKSSSEKASTIENLVAEVIEEGIDVSLNSHSLTTCIETPIAIQNVIRARKSRASSMNISMKMSMSGVGKFDITGTPVSSTPIAKKRIRFEEVD
ncbi:hypothetical protein O3M35_006031 [Rhynocoris fuscipes]|uniref:Disks large-associated protein 5 n=1 Tax=Rhynocoris fuscipes TaxID=488301 RepID=A0AAW1DJ43_9HEMI